jgi:UrcA family protein
VLAGFAFLATTGVASAATDADSPRSVEIRYGDLDLSTEQGAVVLYRRITAGAQQVCPPEDLHNLSAHARSRACQTAAIARAVRAVDNPKLAAVEASHSQKSAAPKSNLA